MGANAWPPTEQFADRLARLRRHRGVDNTAIAEGAGVSVKTVSHWIGGQMPETAALLKLARYFEVSPEWLLDGREADPPMRPAKIQEQKPAHRPTAFDKRAKAKRRKSG